MLGQARKLAHIWFSHNYQLIACPLVLLCFYVVIAKDGVFHEALERTKKMPSYAHVPNPEMQEKVRQNVAVIKQCIVALFSNYPLNDTLNFMQQCVCNRSSPSFTSEEPMFLVERPFVKCNYVTIDLDIDSKRETPHSTSLSTTCRNFALAYNHKSLISFVRKNGRGTALHLLPGDSTVLVDSTAAQIVQQFKINYINFLPVTVKLSQYQLLNSLIDNSSGSLSQRGVDICQVSVQFVDKPQFHQQEIQNVFTQILQSTSYLPVYYTHDIPTLLMVNVVNDECLYDLNLAGLTGNVIR